MRIEELENVIANKILPSLMLAERRLRSVIDELDKLLEDVRRKCHEEE